MASEGTKDFFRVIAAYYIPPLGVFLQVGLSTHFWINLVLSLLGYWPGVVHGIWVIASVDENGEQSAGGNSTLVGLVLSYFLPPIAAFMSGGVVTALINCVLCLFGFFPGQIHAAWVTLQKGEGA